MLLAATAAERQIRRRQLQSLLVGVGEHDGVVEASRRKATSVFNRGKRRRGIGQCSRQEVRQLRVPEFSRADKVHSSVPHAVTL
jgi:hypothetical protein